MFKKQSLSRYMLTSAVALLLGMALTVKLYAFGVEAAMEEKKTTEADTDTAVIVADNSSMEATQVADAGTESSSGSMESLHIGNPESIEAGRQKYGNTCLFCHGAKGVGARAPTLVDGGFAPGGVKDNEYFISIIKYGIPGTIMGTFEGTLTETQMWEIIAYLRDQSEKVAASK